MNSSVRFNPVAGGGSDGSKVLRSELYEYVRSMTSHRMAHHVDAIFVDRWEFGDDRLDHSQMSFIPEPGGLRC